jgi:hypothetical protein
MRRYEPGRATAQAASPSDGQPARPIEAGVALATGVTAPSRSGAQLDGGAPTAIRGEGVTAVALLHERRHEMGLLRRMRAVLADGAHTTVHMSAYDPARTRLRIKRLACPEPLHAWCVRNRVSDAMGGGFLVRADGVPLGELWARGARCHSVSFDPPWSGVRACVHAVGGAVVLARRDELEPEPPGDLLQAGPLLVRDGQLCLDGDPEGFSAASHQFDTDITVGRYPRAALGIDPDGRLLAVVCDGRAPDDAGLSFAELAQTMVALGAERAINLDGGASAALVSEGRLRNVPRGDDGHIKGGRPVVTAVIFTPVGT